MNSEYDKTLQAIQRLLSFASNVTLQNVNDRRPTHESISEMKECCKEITEAGLYSFDPDANDDELLRQIMTFANNVNG